MEDDDEMYDTNQSKKPFLPKGVRGIIYSFIDLMGLLDKIGKLCKLDREYITNCENLD